MTLLDALIIVRAAAVTGTPLGSREDQQALKVVNKKIAALSRKKAWRDSLAGEMPDHAKHPEHPLNRQ